MTLTKEQRRIRDIKKDLLPRKLGNFGIKINDVWTSQRRENERAQKYVEDFADLIAEKSGSLEEHLKEQDELVHHEMEQPKSGTQMTLDHAIARKKKYYKNKKEYEEENQTNLMELD